LIDDKLTNNRAEMRAILHSIELVRDELKETRRLCIFTDSQYCKYIFQGTGERYEKSNFIIEGNEVPNKDMIIKALEYIRKYNIVILKVRAHTEKTDIHSTYNDFADKLANEGAMKMKMGKKYKSNSIIENMKVYHDSIIHPFEKNEIKKSSTPQIEIINKKAETETNIIKEDDNSLSSLSRYNNNKNWREKEKEEFKNKTKLNQIFNVFTDEDDVEEENNKKVTKNNMLEEKRDVTVKIVNNKVIKFKETKLSDFL
jgi:ribonuclease HI